MHRLHDLTGNDDKSLKGESLVCFNFRTINSMKQLTLYYDLFVARLSLFCFPVFCLDVFLFCFVFFFFKTCSIITKADVHSITHTIPLLLSPTPTPRPQTLSLFHPYLINITLSYTRVEKQ